MRGLVELKPMKLQFTTSSLLLATAFLAVCAGGMVPFLKEIQPREWGYIAWLLGMFSPLLAPFPFVAYALGRRALTAKTVMVFAIIEFAALGAFWWLKN